MPEVKVGIKARAQSYTIKIGAGLLDSLGAEVRDCFGANARRAAIISNETVFELLGKAATNSLRRSSFSVSHWLMKDGERHKSWQSLAQALRFLSEKALERNDAVVALGGGVVGDLAGFAAATYLRGLGFIQVPTTLLAQIDASVGGKTAVNLPTGKNLVGAFYQPHLVLIDVNTLRTLPCRELTSGWCEAVKQGAAGDRKLFEKTTRFLSNMGLSLWQNRHRSIQTEVDATHLADLIAAHCRFKASVVAGDEREDPGRTDRRSRKILNFGHTTAHALEAVTNYGRFRHGEAVGHGMLVAGQISKDLGMLASDTLQSLREAVALCGPLPPAGDLSIPEIVSAMTRDKKSVAGTLKWVLLEDLGRARIIDGHEIKPNLLRHSLLTALKNASSRQGK
jgi:3-dehydroquinate synthase